MTQHPASLETVCTDGTDGVSAYFVCYTDNELAGTYPDTCNQFLAIPERDGNTIEMMVYQNELQIGNAPNSTLHIYDILGKELFQSRITSDNQSFDLTHLSNGVLMVVLENEGGRFSKKVVKTGL